MPRLLSIALIVGSVVVVAVLRPGMAEQAVRSPLAWLTVGALIALSAGVRLLVRRVVGPRAAVVASTAVVLTATLLLIGPSFRQRTLVEPLPDGLAQADASVPAPVGQSFVPASEATATAASQAAAQQLAKPQLAVEREMVRSPESPKATAFSAVQPPARSAATAPPPRSTPSPADQPSQPPAQQSANRQVAQGELRGIDHTASGQILLYEVTDGGLVRFQDVNIEGSVKPSVHLVPRGERRPTDTSRLGTLKAERGSFSYQLPASVDLSRGWTVLVWCDPYDTPIAAADLT